MSRNGNHNGIAAPIFTDETVFRQLLHNVARISPFFINFINSHDNGNVRRFSMINGFNGLRHNTVISRYYEDGNIRNLGTASTHGRKRFVTGRIHEGNLFAFITYLISPDMLRNTAGFMTRNVCFADSVEKAGLAMVDVTHNGNYGGTSL